MDYPGTRALGAYIWLSFHFAVLYCSSDGKHGRATAEAAHLIELHFALRPDRTSNGQPLITSNGQPLIGAEVEKRDRGGGAVAAR